MGSYFKPLRRKIGVLTLGLACVFMIGWFRSGYYWEGFDYHASVRVASLDSMVLICIGRVEQSHMAWPDFWSDRVGQFENEVTQKLDSKVNLAGVLFGVTQDLAYVVAAPYAWIVIPLTTLSAWLLFFKPRKRQTPVAPVTKKVA